MRKFVLALAVAALGLGGRALAAPPPLEAYGKLPGVERVELSPSGQRYALIALVGEERRLAVISADGKLIRMAGVGDRKIRDIRWAGEDKVLIYSSDTYFLGPDYMVLKNEIEGVAVLDISKGKATALLNHGAARNGVYGTYAISQEGGRWYAYLGGLTTQLTRDKQDFSGNGTSDLYKVDLETGQERIVDHGPQVGEGDRDWLVAPNGSILAVFDVVDGQGHWRLRSSETGTLLAQGEDPYGKFSVVGQGRTPGTILLTRRDDDDTEHWIEMPLTGGEGTEILAHESVEQPYFDPKTGLLVGYLGAAEAEPVFFDPVMEAHLKAIERAFAGSNISLKSWNDDWSKVVVFTNGSQDSGTWWLVDLVSSKAEAIGWAYPAVPPEEVGTIKTVSYKAADGLAMEGILTLPPHREAKNLPLVVLPHGGPWARDYADFDWWAQAFASRGYAVFQPNFRGSTGYGGAFENAADGEWGGKMQTDISDGVAELAREGVVDPRRACIVGASYGGYAALAGVTIQQGLYRCAVSVAGVSDLRPMLDQIANKYGSMSAATRNWKRDVGSGRELNAISPMRLAAHADAPILLIHGKDDTVVPFDQSVRMKAALEAAGKPVEMVVLNHEDHWLSRGDTRLQMLQAAVAFVEKYDPPN